jgi:hypothetical protein
MWTIALSLLALLLVCGSLDLAHADQLQPLIKDLHSADTDTRLKAIHSLGASGDIRAISPLLDSAYREEGRMRQYAVDALQNLARLLDDVHVVVKRWLQSLIDTLRLDADGERTTVARPAPSRPLASAGGGMRVTTAGGRACA